MTRHKSRALRHRQAAAWLVGVGAVLLTLVIGGNAVGTNLTAHPASAGRLAPRMVRAAPAPTRAAPPPMVTYTPTPAPPPAPALPRVAQAPPAPPTAARTPTPAPPPVVHPAPPRAVIRPPVAPAPAPTGPSYANCDDVRAHGAAPIHPGDPGFQPKFDRDHDGVGCE